MKLHINYFPLLMFFARKDVRNMRRIHLLQFLFSVLNNLTETGELLAEYKVTYSDEAARAKQRYQKPSVIVNETSKDALSLRILIGQKPQDEGPYWCVMTVIFPVDSKSSEKVKLNITSK